MSKQYKKIIESINNFHKLPEAFRSEFFDAVIEPLIAEMKEKVRTNSTKQNLKEWLFIQYATLGLAVEGITELTDEYFVNNKKELKAIVLTMPLEQRLGLELLFDEFEGHDHIDTEIVPANFEMGRLGSVADIEVLGEFRGTSTFQSSRGFPVSHGMFTLYSAQGEVISQYITNSGGGSKNFSTTNGPLPPGIYLVSNHRPNRKTTGMVLSGIGYSFDLDPTDGTQVYGRSLFRIHPDGLNEGTNGCLGIREPNEKLIECEQQIIGLFKQGKFKIRVTYT